MGSVVYDFLADSLFFNENSLKNNFANEKEDRIETELQDYRQHCIKNYTEIMTEIVERDSFLKVFSSRDTSLRLLKQTALYVDQFIISDPLFSLADNSSEESGVVAKYLGYENDGKIDRNSLGKAALFLKEITPMVRGNYVKVFPFIDSFEDRKGIPFKLSTDVYENALPKEIMDFFLDNITVNSMEKRESGGWSVLENKLIPSRGIIIDFKDEDVKSSMIFHLLKTEVLDSDKESRIIELRQTLPSFPPTEKEFVHWVNQSVHSTCKGFYNRVLSGNIISVNLNSTYLCDSQFVSKLISKNFASKQTIQTETAANIINFDLPFLDNIDTEKLMNVREFDADLFTNFRLELERNFRDLRDLNDPILIKEKTENIFHEMNDVQVYKINKKMKHVKKQFIPSSLIALGGLAGSFSTGGASLLATAMAFVKGYKDYNEYMKDIRENPSYLLWKVIRK